MISYSLPTTIIPHFNRQKCWAMPIFLSFFLVAAINVTKTIIRMIRTSFFFLVIYFVTLEVNNKKMFYGINNNWTLHAYPYQFNYPSLFGFFFALSKTQIIIFAPNKRHKSMKNGHQKKELGSILLIKIMFCVINMA